MKLKLILLACIIGLLSCAHQKGVVNVVVDSTKDKVNKPQLAKDTICAIHKISWSKSVDLKNKFNDISNTFLFGNNLFLLSQLDTTILIMNTGSGEINIPVTLNKSLKLLFPIVKYPTEVFASKNAIYVGFTNGIAKFDNDFKLIFKIVLEQRLKHFTVFKEGQISIYYENGSVSFYNPNTKPTNVKNISSLDLSGNIFIKSRVNSYTEGFDTLFTVDLIKDSLERKFVNEPSKFNDFKPFKDHFPGFIDDKYIYWFPYQKRNCLIITDTKVTKIIKNIPFKGFDWSVTNEEENDEMDQNRHPEFYVDVDDDNNFYITNYMDGTLSVFKGCLGLQ